jgi:hypothetical protein
MRINYGLHAATVEPFYSSNLGNLTFFRRVFYLFFYTLQKLVQASSMPKRQQGTYQDAT